MQQATTTRSTSAHDLDVKTIDRGELDETLRRVAEMQAALETGPAHAEPARLLAQLRVHLELHFAREESGGYFGAMLRQHQSLSHPIALLRREHGELLDALQSVRAIAADVRRSTELAVPLLRLLEQFRAHEHKEAELLQELVLRDDGTGAD